MPERGVVREESTVREKTGVEETVTHITIKVPLGTVVHRLSGEKGYVPIGDVTTTDNIVVACGGQRGRGNASFASAIQREPLLAEAGQAGERFKLFLELKLIADVGIIGPPNAGKSTLISACSAARPKIADYPFTTLDPVLGVAEAYGESFVLVEVPGLIEGAHMGVGLGHEFLRHAERVRLIWQVVDSSGEDPIGALETVGNELAMFSDALTDKQRMVVINKVDIPEGRERAEDVRKTLVERGIGVYLVSAATGEGVEQLLGETLTMLQRVPKEEAVREVATSPAATHVTVNLPDDVTREGNVYLVRSARLERIAALADVRDQRVIDQLWNELVRLGLDRRMVEKGIEPGNVVRVGRVELEWK